MNQIRKRVLALLKKGALTEAVIVAAEFTRRNPKMAESYGLLSQAEEIAGYTKAAIKTVSHAIALAPNEPGYFLQRSRLHLKINAAADALEDATHLIELEASQGSAHFADLANAYRDEALERLQRRPGGASPARMPSPLGHRP